MADMLHTIRKHSKTESLLDLASLSRQDLARFFVEDLEEKRFRAGQVWRWIHQQGARNFEEMSNLSKDLRKRLSETARIGGLRLVHISPSNDDTRKLVLETREGHRVESVIIPSSPGSEGDDTEEADVEDSFPSLISKNYHGKKRSRITVCFSTQVGCAMDCGFCYTASLGLARNLKASEIVDQIHHAQQVLGENKITNLVAMGMGEPLANLPNLLVALDALNSVDGMAFAARRITVSTVGLVPQMKKLGEASKVNLAVSLSATTDELRDKLMPINRRYPLQTLLQTCRDYPLASGRRITFEYVLLKGVNDSIEDAKRLTKLLRGIPCKVNLLPLNEHEKSDFQRPSNQRVLAFQKILLRHGFATSIRISRGRDVTAACGQLGHTASTGIKSDSKLS